MAADLGDSTLTNVTGGIATPKGVEDVSPLEQDLLDEYERLADNMKKVGSDSSFPIDFVHICAFWVYAHG